MLAIDKHLIPFTGADRHNDNFVISGKSKGGTSQFETYATMQVVTEKQLPTIAVVRLTDDISKIEFVRKLLSESKKLGLKKPLLLMDREFSSVDVMRFLDERREIPDGSQQDAGNQKGRLGVSQWQKKGNISDTR